MEHQRYRHSIVPVHYFEAFFERFFVVDSGLAFLHVVCHDGMYVSQQELATLSFMILMHQSTSAEYRYSVSNGISRAMSVRA